MARSEWRRRLAQEALGFLTEAGYTAALGAVAILLSILVVWLMR